MCFTVSSRRIRVHHGKGEWQQVAGMGRTRKLSDPVFKPYQEAERANWNWVQATNSQNPIITTYFFFHQNYTFCNFPQVEQPTGDQMFKYLSLWGI